MSTGVSDLHIMLLLPVLLPVLLLLLLQLLLLLLLLLQLLCSVASTSVLYIGATVESCRLEHTSAQLASAL